MIICFPLPFLLFRAFGGHPYPEQLIFITYFNAAKSLAVAAACYWYDMNSNAQPSELF